MTGRRVNRAYFNIAYRVCYAKLEFVPARCGGAGENVDGFVRELGLRSYATLTRARKLRRVSKLQAIKTNYRGRMHRRRYIRGSPIVPGQVV